MVEPRAVVLDSAFAALADPTRRAILGRLAEGSSTVTELAAPFEISLQAVSKHLQVLERAGLIERKRHGRTHHCRLNAAPLREAVAWMDQYKRFWDARLGALADYLTGEDEAR